MLVPTAEAYTIVLQKMMETSICTCMLLVVDIISSQQKTKERRESMSDLDEIVESFKLNINRISPERLAEIAGLLDAVPRTRLNEILDKMLNDEPREEVIWAIGCVRREIQKAI